MSLALRKRCFLLHLHKVVQSGFLARQWMKGLAEYLVIFSYRKASSVVQSKLAEH